MSKAIRSKIVKTRKPHRCFGCARLFEAGTEMLKEEVVDDGMWTCYLCNTCASISNELEPWDEFGYSDLREEALEREGNRNEI